MISHAPLVQYKMCLDPTKCEECPNRENCLLDVGAVILRQDEKIRLRDGRTLTVKAGFDFDGVSVPRAFWSSTYHPFHHRTIAAGLGHDALYASELLPRAEADAIFRDLLADWGVSWYTRNKMWIAVRVAGGGVWAQHDPEEVEYYRTLVTLE